MVMFIDPVIEGNGVRFNIVGEKTGTVIAKSIGDACYKLLKYLTKDDVVYIDKRGIGTAVVDSLSRYVNVVGVMPTKKDIISEL